jgi:hypothetical protein
VTHAVFAQFIKGVKLFLCFHRNAYEIHNQMRCKFGCELAVRIVVVLLAGAIGPQKLFLGDFFQLARIMISYPYVEIKILE